MEFISTATNIYSCLAYDLSCWNASVLFSVFSWKLVCWKRCKDLYCSCTEICVTQQRENALFTNHILIVLLDLRLLKKFERSVFVSWLAFNINFFEEVFSRLAIHAGLYEIMTTHVTLLLVLVNMNVKNSVTLHLY